MFAMITQVQTHYFIFLLDVTEMAQNNSVFVFVWTANSSRGRPHLRIVMNKVINLKSVGFTWKKQEIYFEFL